MASERPPIPRTAIVQLVELPSLGAGWGSRRGFLMAATGAKVENREVGEGHARAGKMSGPHPQRESRLDFFSPVLIAAHHQPSVTLPANPTTGSLHQTLDPNMSRCTSLARPLARQLCSRPRQGLAARSLTTTTPWSAPDVQQQQQQPSTSASPLDQNPDTVLPEFEESLIKAGQMPVGSRRRRVAMRTTTDPLPFEQLPYQAFQEARKILAADRQEKLQRIRDETAKIAWLEARDASQVKGGQYMKDTKLASLRRHVEQLKILADINDPLVKKRFEDGLGKSNHSIQLPIPSIAIRG